MAFVIRILKILGAFLTASLAAGLIILTVLMTTDVLPQRPPLRVAEFAFIYLLDVVFFEFLISLIVAKMACAPALILIIIAERFYLRSALYYTISAGLVGLIGAYLMFVQTGSALGTASGSALLASFAVAGSAGGLVYWALAGRNAGRWREQLLSPPG